MPNCWEVLKKELHLRIFQKARSSILGNGGLSLIEVTISMALLVLTMLAFADYRKIHANGNASVELNNVFTGVASSVMLALGSQKLCTEVLTGQKFDPTLAYPQLLSKPLAMGTPTPVVLASPGPWGNGLILQNLQFTQSYGNSGSNYVLGLHIEGQKKALQSGQKYVGTQVLSKDYLVNVTVDTVGKVITGCN